MQIRDNPAIVSIQFLKGTEDRVFCMAFARFLASSVTAKIAARIPSRRTATSRRLRAGPAIPLAQVPLADTAPGQVEALVTGAGAERVMLVLDRLR